MISRTKSVAITIIKRVTKIMARYVLVPNAASSTPMSPQPVAGSGGKYIYAFYTIIIGILHCSRGCFEKFQADDTDNTGQKLGAENGVDETESSSLYVFIFML
jgi:hypothetical protein